MSISGTRKSGRVQNNAKRGAHFVRESANKKVMGISQKRALFCGRRTLSETSIPHLVDFLKYSDGISLIPFHPVWDVYYYTSRREGKAARAFPARELSLPDLRFPGPRCALTVTGASSSILSCWQRPDTIDLGHQNGSPEVILASLSSLTERTRPISH